MISFSMGGKSVTERHKVTLPFLMLRKYDEKEILVRDQFPLFQLILTDLGFGKWTFLKSCSVFQQGQEVDAPPVFFGERCGQCLGVLRKCTHDRLPFRLV